MEKTTRSGRNAGKRAATALAVVVVVIAGVAILDRENAYLWLKAFHVMAIIAWMAGLLYLPRLFIYHRETEPGSDASDRFVTMEKRLYSIIMNPAMMIAWVLGLYLGWDGFRFAAGWLHAKIFLVVLLTVAHVYFGRLLDRFSKGERPLSQRHLRIMNEVPALLMMAIVILVVVKPF